MTDRRINRRKMLKLAAGAFRGALPQRLLPQQADEINSSKGLRAIVAKCGRHIGMYSYRTELTEQSAVGQTIVHECDMLASGLDLKWDRLRPTPSTFDFSAADWDLRFAAENGLLFHAHTLVWHNALPQWFYKIIDGSNAARFLSEHIETVCSHCANQVHSWDVVNEAIRPQDGRPDGLRIEPWLRFLGPEYIQRSFWMAQEADPTAKLVLNETSIEHDVPLHAAKRKALARLLWQVVKDGAPIHYLGIQSHLQAGVPIAKAELGRLMDSARNLGLGVMITEMDVNDTLIPEGQREEIVAKTYEDYVTFIAPYADVIICEQLTDRNTWFEHAPEMKRRDGLPHEPALFDRSVRRKSAYYRVQSALMATCK